MTSDQKFQMLMTLVGIVISLGGAFGSAVIGLLWKLVKNIIKLNATMGLVVAEVGTHDKRISRLEDSKPATWP